MKLAGGIGVVLAVLAAVGAWVATGFFTVEPDEQAVILRLGRYHHTAEPGLPWHARWIDTIEKHKVKTTKDVEFGFRTIPSATESKYEDRPEEKRMVTSDENLVNVELVVRYRIGNLRDYLFNLNDPEQTLRDVSASAIRAVVAKIQIDELLTRGKNAVEVDARDRIRSVLERYGAGIEVQSVQLQDVEPPDAVKDAFAEVTSAEQEGARMVLEARGYAEKVVPEARGDAQAKLAAAQAYKQSRVLRARGDADRFNALLTEYRRAPRVTRDRLYIETLEQILPGMDKVILEEGGSDRVLPYLPVGRRGGER